jgi:UDP-N-acetylmuramate--alanine ligase
MNLKDFKNIFFIGIGGSGMSSLANYFIHENKNISGYDRSCSLNTKNLISKGVSIITKQSIENINKQFLNNKETLIIYTPAIQSNSPLLKYFKENSFVVLKRAEVLGIIANNSFCVAIAGTHGKTTTTSILGHLLKYCNKPATVFLGGISENYNSNLIINGKDIVVVEADEFDKSFLTLKPNIACITSIDLDHLDIYKDIEDIRKSFEQFISQMDNQGTLIVNENVDFSGDKFGFKSSSKYIISNINLKEGYYYFDINYNKKTFSNFKFSLMGKHNLSNALAALIIAIKLDCDLNELKDALESFGGVKRRYTIHINSSSMVYIDDYAHHPDEIKVVYDSLLELYPNEKYLVAFQPHLFSRTRDFIDEFASVLSKFHTVLLLDIYPARELPIDGVTSSWLLSKINAPVKKIVELEKLDKEIFAQKNKINVTLGAGDIGDKAEEIKKQLEYVI